MRVEWRRGKLPAAQARSAVPNPSLADSRRADRLCAACAARHGTALGRMEWHQLPAGF